MLYLEDYLEMIEHLPGDLRDRFTEMREMDLSVQNNIDRLEQKQKSFFANCRKLKASERDETYDQIKKGYAKVLEESGEKITNAEDTYNLVDRYLRRLDQELHKFKMELEADNRGITEVLEKRSLEMDNPSSSTAKENRHPKKHSRKNLTIAHPSSSPTSSSSSSLALGFSLDSTPRPTPKSQRNQFLFSDSSPMLLDNVTYPLQHMGAGGNAIAAAASQAIAATQQLVPGRRTSSLKASYEAINLGLQTHEFSIGRELAGAAQSALAATAFGDAPPMPPQAKRQKVSKRSSSSSVDPGTPQPSSMLDVVNSSSSLMDESLLEGTMSPEDLLQPSGSRSEQDWNYDPSEPRYCVCNQVSYGDMVACDNVDCPYEWFHYPCVGITATPKGKWYCPTCLARRKGRK